ncbi:MAG: ATP12 family protein [Pseudomonadota bacterium]
MKVFWTEVTVTDHDDGQGLALDGRPVKTPAKAPLILPTRALAEAVAGEWRAQSDQVRPETMPLTRAANTAIDRVALALDAVARELADYGDADLLCYRADHPHPLVARQAAAWDPLVAWSAATLGAPLDVAEGLVHRPQPAGTLDALAHHVRRHDAWEMTALHDLVTLSGSLVIGLAVSHRHLTAAEAWPLSRIDEDWNAEQWGEDAEAADVAARKRRSFETAAQLIALVRSD